MTTMVVPAKRPDENVLSGLQSVSGEQATALYRAALADVCETVLHGEADLLVNYPNPEWFEEDVDPESELRSILDEELASSDAVRYEVQVGETPDSRVGNALTHLLDAENEATVAVVEPTVSLLLREHIGTLAMKLRTSDVVVGPSQNGDTYLAGFGQTVDFDGIYDRPAIQTVTNRARSEGLDVGFLPQLPRIDSPTGLASTVSLVRARKSADRAVPTRTTRAIEDIGLRLEDDGTVSTASS